MHRFILGLTNPKIKTDHKDGDGLNNQKENIRACNNQQNNFNHRKLIIGSSKYKGVIFDKKERGEWGIRNKRWRARIRINGNLISLGYYNTEFEAAKAYNKAAQNYFGNFANLNKGV